jgi:Zn-ribbon RNA-binding protein
MAKKKEDVKEAKAEEKMPQINVKAVRGDKCISCNTSVVNDAGSVRFQCPNCGKYLIIRCSKCRKTVAQYKCPVCGFEGPN